MKKVIWVTSFFPPCVNVATARNTKLLKYLPANGWEALVVCPDYKIEHTENSRALLSQLSPFVRVSRSGPDWLLSLVSRRGQNRIARYTSYIMNNVIPPDGHVFWALASMKHLGKEIKRYKPDLVYTTCNPYSLNLLGAWARIKFGLPWVTDFRDLWTLNQQPRRAFGFYNQIVSSYLERRYVRCCDGFIANTDNSKKRMVAKYPGLSGKIEVVPNGYDPQDIQTNEPDSVISNSFFYSGSIVANTPYHPLGVLKILGSLENSGKLASNWQLHYAGGQGTAFKEYAAQAGIQMRCVDHGYLDHKRYYGLIRKMDYIIMALPYGLDCSSWIPSRLYDYMGNKAKIICLAPRGSEVFVLLKRYENGVALFYEDPEDLNTEKLNRYLKQIKNENVVPQKFISHYSRESQARKLSKIFDAVKKNVSR